MVITPEMMDAFTGIDQSLLTLWFMSAAVSIGLALGLTIYNIRRENKLRRRNERFFVIQIQANLKHMAQYFLDVEGATTRNEESETSTEDLMGSLKSYYVRHGQEMKDVLYQTKLYLPFWTSLSTHDKETITGILDVFTWLLYEYYQPSLPEPLRENKVLTSRRTLYNKKEHAMKNVNQILQIYST